MLLVWNHRRTHHSVIRSPRRPRLFTVVCKPFVLTTPPTIVLVVVQSNHRPVPRSHKPRAVPVSARFGRKKCLSVARTVEVPSSRVSILRATNGDKRRYFLIAPTFSGWFRVLHFSAGPGGCKISPDPFSRSDDIKAHKPAIYIVCIVTVVG